MRYLPARIRHVPDNGGVVVKTSGPTSKREGQTLFFFTAFRAPDPESRWIFLEQFRQLKNGFLGLAEVRVAWSA